MTERRFPRVGDIIGYLYLWKREAQFTDEGRKVRPCMVLAADETSRQVIVVPMTTKGEVSAKGMLIPDVIAITAGLRSGTSVVCSETNVFTWQGYDLRPLTQGRDIYVGRLTPRFTDKIISSALGAKPTNRD